MTETNAPKKLFAAALVLSWISFGTLFLKSDQSHHQQIDELRERIDSLLDGDEITSEHGDIFWIWGWKIYDDIDAY